jgi:hypothetical protein
MRSYDLMGLRWGVAARWDQDNESAFRRNSQIVLLLRMAAEIIAAGKIGTGKITPPPVDRIPDAGRSDKT